jgi:hypothetical protein
LSNFSQAARPLRGADTWRPYPKAIIFSPEVRFRKYPFIWVDTKQLYWGEVKFNWVNTTNDDRKRPDKIIINDKRWGENVAVNIYVFIKCSNDRGKPDHKELNSWVLTLNQDFYQATGGNHDESLSVDDAVDRYNSLVQKYRCTALKGEPLRLTTDQNFVVTDTKKIDLHPMRKSTVGNDKGKPVATRFGGSWETTTRYPCAPVLPPMTKSSADSAEDQGKPLPTRIGGTSGSREVCE